MKLFITLISLFVLSTSLFTSSCSVNYSFSGADVPAEAKTLSVGYFSIDPRATNANPIAPDLFTNALIATMLTQTNLDVVANNGDLQFEGSIIRYTNTPVAAQSNTESSARNRITMAVNVTYTNTIEPDKSFENRTFSQFTDFDASDNLNDIEEDLIGIINEAITQDIFNSSVGSW